MKNGNKGKSRKKDFLANCPAEKERAFFRQWMLRKLYGKEATKKKKSKKG
jgi:hypothetical protein